MVLQLTAKRIDVSMDVPGDKQSFNFSETSAKLQINNTFAPVNGGANNLLITESKNSYNGGFRWKHTTAYNASPSASPGTYSLYRFVNSGAEVETEIFSIDGTGNIIFDNNVTVNGTLMPSVLTVPSTVDVTGTTQTFQYNGDHTSKFVLKNLYAASVGTPSTVELDFINSTTGGYKFIHSSATTDTAGLGTLKLKVMNNVGTAIDILTFGVDGGGVPTIGLNGTLTCTGTNYFNYGATGQSVFYVSPTIPDPTNSTDAASKGYVDLSTVTIAGAVNGSAALSSTVNTTLNSSIAVQGASETFTYTGNHNVTFNLVNSEAATLGNPSTIKLNFTNSTTGGYRFIHTSQSTDTAGLGQFKLQVYNNVGTTEDIYNVSIDGGGVPVFDYYGTLNVHGSSFFNIGGIGQSVFYVSPTIPDPTNPTDAASKQWVESAIASNSISLTGAVTGSGTSSIATTLNSLISVSGGTQTFQIAGNAFANFIIKNTLAPSVGVPSNVSLYFLNSTTGGYFFRHTLQTTDSDGLGQLSLKILNSIGVSSDVFVVSIISSTTTFTLSTPAVFSSTLDMSSQKILNLATPVSSTDGANKGYVDSSLSAYTTTLTGAVTGSGTGSIATTLASSITMASTSETFTFAGNNTAKFILSNSFAASVGTPSTVELDFVNSTTGGFKILHTSSTTDTAGLGTLKFQVNNNAGVTQDLATLSVNSGTGIGDIAFASTANFNNTVSFNGSSAGSAINLASYAFTLNNTHATGITEYIISNSTPYLKLGVNNSTSLAYVDSVGQAFQIRMSGTAYVHFSTSGYQGIGTTSPTQAKLVISGGVANVASEDSCLRVTGSSNATKIELANTSASGKLFELRSSNSGSFDITDRTASTTRFTINTSGNAIFSGNIAVGGASANAPLQFPTTTVSRKIVLYEEANNDHQFLGLGINPGVFRFQVGLTSENYVFYAATSSSSSNEVFRILGTGGIQFNNTNTSPLTYYADVSLSNTWTGYNVPSASKTVRCVRVGKKVTLYLQLVSGTVTTPGALAFSGTLDADFRPASQNEFIIPVLDNGTVRVGILSITSGGSITILTTSSTGAQTTFSSGSCGLSYDACVSYVVS